MMETLPVTAFLLWQAKYNSSEKDTDPVARELHEVLEQIRSEEQALSFEKTPDRRSTRETFKAMLHRFFSSPKTANPAFSR